MADKVRVAVDAMGGDNAPGEIVKGAVAALNEQDKLELFLLGDEAKITDVLKDLTYDKERVTVLSCSEVVTNEDHPVDAVKRKKDSSMVRAMHLVRDGEADALVSAGNSGAVLAGGQLIVGRIRGIKRAPFASLIPTNKGFSLLLDAGANVDASAQQLVQYAEMGSIYMEHVMGVKNPRVCLVNLGLEEEKGNALVKETHPLLKELTGINYCGFIESRQIPFGDADVIVCDAFVGNALLKFYEGTAKMLMGEIKGALMSSLTGKIGGLLIKKSLKTVLKKFDAKKYGGAPMLGLKGLVVKTHGNAKAEEIHNAVLQCITFKDQRIAERIKEHLVDNKKEEK